MARGFFGVQKHKKVIWPVVPGILIADLLCSCGMTSRADTTIDRIPLASYRAWPIQASWRWRLYAIRAGKVTQSRPGERNGQGDVGQGCGVSRWARLIFAGGYKARHAAAVLHELHPVGQVLCRAIETGGARCAAATVRRVGKVRELADFGTATSGRTHSNSLRAGAGSTTRGLEMCPSRSTRYAARLAAAAAAAATNHFALRVETHGNRGGNSQGIPLQMPDSESV
jgi:hypothetical protein